VPINFQAHLDRSGEAVFDLGSLSLSKETTFITEAWHKRDADLAYFRLTGESADGVRLVTDHLYFNSVGTKSSAEGAFLSFAAHSADVTLRRSVPTLDNPLLTLWLRSFRCFPAVNTACPLGSVVAQGDVTQQDADKLTGHLSLQAKEVPGDLKQWRSDAEKLLDHVRRVLSFAEGTILADPVLEFRCGDVLEVNVKSRTVHDGARLPATHMLDRQAIFEAGTRSYFKPPFPVENLWMALEWIAMPATYNEVHLLNAMTALENLVASNTRDIAELFDEQAFKGINDMLSAAITAHVTNAGLLKDHPKLLEEVIPKLQELRRRSLKRRLDVLLERWSVPMDGITNKMIRAAIDARNGIVHEGRYRQQGKNQQSLWDQVTLVREIVTRITFRALGFHGRYVSHLGGYHEAVFPPAPEAKS
jgi:hypothetical protein